METRGNNFVATTSGCISGPAKEDPNLTSVNVMLFGRPKVGGGLYFSFFIVSQK